MIDIKKQNVWVLKTTTSGGRVAKYCHDKHIAAVGWSLIDEDVDITNFEDYLKIAEEKYGKVNIVRRLAEGIQVNDLIWMRDADDGKYYLARKTKESIWEFANNDEDKKLDVANRLINIDWIEIGDESCVPGVIRCQFHRPGQTLFKINYGINSARLFSALKYNERTNTNYYLFDKMESNNKDYLFELLSPDEVEDLCYFYLYSKYKYIVVPSSNKMGTPHYEFVMLDPTNKEKRIYIQVKNKKNDYDLDSKDFVELCKNPNNEVYLFTRGKVANLNYSNIKSINDDMLYNWLMETESDELVISDAIIDWLNFISTNEMKNCVKGIMFDTNKTYYENDEDDMLNEHKIWAKGNPKRYLKSFNMNDYVLYYSKGKGIIAIGKIKDKEPYEIDNGNGLARNVEIIVPEEKYLKQVREKECIYPNEIKQLLGKDFFFASTIKTPFLSEKEVNILIEALENKYNNK